MKNSMTETSQQVSSLYKPHTLSDEPLALYCLFYTPLAQSVQHLFLFDIINIVKLWY